MNIKTETRPFAFQARNDSSARRRALPLFVTIAAILLVGNATLIAQNANTAAEDEPKADIRTNLAAGERVNEDATSETENARESFRRQFDQERGKRGIHRSALVVRGKDVVLKAGESVEAVVVIGGSARILGKVRDAVVVIGGDIEVEGEVGEAVVAVLGNVKIEPGAKLHGDLVAVGGKAEIAEGATVEGHIQDVDFDAMGLPNVDWIRAWFRHCGLK